MITFINRIITCQRKNELDPVQTTTRDPWTDLHLDLSFSACKQQQIRQKWMDFASRWNEI